MSLGKSERVMLMDYLLKREEPCAMAQPMSVIPVSGNILRVTWIFCTETTAGN